MKPSSILSTVIVAVSLSAATGAAAAPPDDDGTPSPADPTVEEFDPNEIVHSWALAPSTSEDGSTRSQFSYTAAPGTVIEDSLTIYNFGTEALPFRIYSTDAFNNPQGDFALLAGDEVPVDLGSWVTLELDTLVVNPGRQVTIPFTIDVPESATSGDHSGALLASSPTTAQTGDNEGQVVVDRRTGARMFVRVAGDLTPQLEIEGLTTDLTQSANPFGASATVTYRLENRGNVRLSGTAEVDVAGPLGLGGSSAEPIQFDQLLPGEGFDVAVELDGITPLGLLETTVTAELTAGDGDEVDPVTRSNSQFAPPIALLLALLIILFGIIGFRAVRRHRSPEVEVIAPTDDREFQDA